MTIAVALEPTLDELEAIVDRGLQTFVEVGQALAEIRERRLYRDQYDSFEVYCRSRFNFNRQRASQLIKAAEVSRILDSPPTRASHAEALARLPDPETRQEVHDEVRAAKGKRATQADYDDAIEKRARPSVSSKAEASDLGDDAPAYEGQSQDTTPAGPVEHFCSECGGKYLGEACPCKAWMSDAETPAPTASIATTTERARASAHEWKPRIAPIGPSAPALRTDGEGNAILAIPNTAGDLTRALSASHTPAQIAEALLEAYSAQELGSLVAQVIDRLPESQVAPLAHRVTVRVKNTGDLIDPEPIPTIPTVSTVKAQIDALETGVAAVASHAFRKLNLAAMKAHLTMVQTEIARVENPVALAAAWGR